MFCSLEKLKVSGVALLVAQDNSNPLQTSPNCQKSTLQVLVKDVLMWKHSVKVLASKL